MHLNSFSTIKRLAVMKFWIGMVICHYFFWSTHKPKMRINHTKQSIKVCGKPHNVSSITWFKGIVWYKESMEIDISIFLPFLQKFFCLLTTYSFHFLWWNLLKVFLRALSLSSTKFYAFMSYDNWITFNTVASKILVD